MYEWMKVNHKNGQTILGIMHMREHLGITWATCPVSHEHLGITWATCPVSHEHLARGIIASLSLFRLSIRSHHHQCHLLQRLLSSAASVSTQWCPGSVPPNIQCHHGVSKWDTATSDHHTTPAVIHCDKRMHTLPSLHHTCPTLVWHSCWRKSHHCLQLLRLASVCVRWDYTTCVWITHSHRFHSFSQA